jgi:hypothetical protein
MELVPDSWVGAAPLKKGHNAIAVRNCGSLYGWRFFLRLTEPDGGRLKRAWWEY